MDFIGLFRSSKIKSLFIANRGEIAVRIIETAKKLKIKTYVIKSTREPKALYVQLADESIEVEENMNSGTVFLDIEKIISIIKKNKIDAVHPGYGFLAESPYFAKRCEEEKINFIGPSADAIYKMGNKTIAREIARKNNIPLLEGSAGALKSIDEAFTLADKIGYPVILKAASDGGGRGMRIVRKAEEMEKMFKLASSEAEKAFNDSSMFMEKYVENPKHIEFQIIADKKGKTIHLGERECSIQRKHQKLMEEAPSNAIDENLRKKMGEVAVRMAKAANYYSAGTVEFLLDRHKNFYFMEMNTRIQVEHPVTEMVTGLDLIELQIKVAEGEKLKLSQQDVNIEGCAIECRINAEDVQANFAPNLGIVEKMLVPKGKTVRVDTGIQNGSEITPYYDSMIAKLIVYGKTRKQAVTNTLNALKRVKIKGLKTTIPFCKLVLNHPKFRSGEFNTSFVEKDLEQLFYQEPFEDICAAYIATSDYLNEVYAHENPEVDYKKGKELNPWVLNKRLKSI